MPFIKFGVHLMISILYFKKKMEDIQSAKAIIQQILDRHLPEEERFSIDGLSNDRLEFLVEFLLEEDEIERDKIWARLEEEIKNNLKIDNLEVQKIKDLLDYEKLEKWELQDLLNLVHSEKELEQEIKDLDF